MTDLTLAELDQQVPAVANGMPLTMAIMLNDRLFERTKLIATYLSKAQGFVPPHLIGKPEACFAVVMTALTWKLNPFMVAKSTYSTPGGQVGYEGKLCQAILENSGRLEGNVKFQHYGDWSKVQGKFEIRKSQKGNDFAVPTWNRKDADGLGVTVRAKVKGEEQPREWKFDLIQAFPLNSTLWATDPKTQICYTAVRRFASVAAPGLFMGVPFEGDDDPSLYAKDITSAAPPPPRPTKAEFAAPPAETVTDVEPEDAPERFDLIDEFGEVAREEMAANAFLDVLEDRIGKAGQPAALWEHNADAAERAAEVVENGAEILARLRQAVEPKGDATDWPAKVEELKAGAAACADVQALVAFKRANKATVDAMPDDVHADWCDFAEARAAALKGPK